RLPRDDASRVGGRGRPPRRRPRIAPADGGGRPAARRGPLLRRGRRRPLAATARPLERRTPMRPSLPRSPRPARPRGQGRGHLAPAYRDLLPDGLPDELESVGTVKNGPHRTVERVEVAGVAAFWKHCRLLGLRGWLRQGLRPPKAKIEFDKALALAAR